MDFTFDLFPIITLATWLHYLHRRGCCVDSWRGGDGGGGGVGRGGVCGARGLNDRGWGSRAHCEYTQRHQEVEEEEDKLPVKPVQRNQGEELWLWFKLKLYGLKIHSLTSV